MSAGGLMVAAYAWRRRLKRTGGVASCEMRHSGDLGDVCISIGDRSDLFIHGYDGS